MGSQRVRHDWVTNTNTFLSDFSKGSLAHLPQWLQLLMTATSFIYWYGRTYSISQLAMQINCKKFKCLVPSSNYIANSNSWNSIKICRNNIHGKKMYIMFWCGWIDIGRTEKSTSVVGLGIRLTLASVLNHGVVLGTFLYLSAPQFPFWFSIYQWIRILHLQGTWNNI